MTYGPNKYHARRCEIDHRHFPELSEIKAADSRVEYIFLLHLVYCLRGGVITAIAPHLRVTIPGTVIRYTMDALVSLPSGRSVGFDVKGVTTDRWRIVKQQWAESGEYPLIEVKRDGQVWVWTWIVPRACEAWLHGMREELRRVSTVTTIHKPRALLEVLG